MKVNFKYLLTISLVTALGGLLFGFDISVISGTIPFLQEYFELNEAMKGWVVSSALIGCILGASYAGRLGDIFGRKKVLLVVSILFGISAIGSGLAQLNYSLYFLSDFGWFGGWRSICFAPMYIAEVSPAEYRGRMVSLNQLTIVLGISMAYFSNYFLLAIGENAWRWMFAAEAVPSLFFFFALFIVPESPRWLVARNEETKAHTSFGESCRDRFCQF